MKKYKIFISQKNAGRNKLMWKDVIIENPNVTLTDVKH